MQLNSKLHLFRSITLSIFVTAMSRVQANDRLVFNAANSERGDFDVARYVSSNNKSKGTIIFIYGGNATAPPFGNELELDTFDREILLANGYTLVIPNYRKYINRRTPNYARLAFGTDAQKKEDVESDVASQIMDLKKFIADYKAKYPNESLVLMGHSYGAHLVNILSSENQMESAVDAYVSSHGIWGPFDSGNAKFYQKIKPQLNSIKPMLVFLSKNDIQTGNHTEYFNEWYQKSAANEQLKFLIFEGNGHFLNPKNHPSYKILTSELLKFLDKVKNDNTSIGKITSSININDSKRSDTKRIEDHSKTNVTTRQSTAVSK